MTQTLAEFLAPLKKAPRRAQVLAVLYFETHDGQADSLTSAEIRLALKRARVPGHAAVNVPDVLGKAGHLVDSTRDGGRHLQWRLTDSGNRYVSAYLPVEGDELEVVNDISTLASLATQISDPIVRGYVEEALLCLQAGALRAAVVFMWSGAIRTIQESCLAQGAGTLNAAIAKHDPKAKSIAKIEDFAAIKDVTTLIAARELGLIDKGEWQTLGENLSLRNRCGHPTKYTPGVKKTSGFVEDVVGIVY
ncbi:MAG: hypothetical protein Q7K25_04945 [Actinomycetota bacterium]|nr:hypothetical protein [Actinomycetota bacterium]